MACGTTLESLYLIVLMDKNRYPLFDGFIYRVLRTLALSGWSGRKIFRWLRETKFVARSGKPLTLSNIYTILNNHFYYGTFEYPRTSGRWFQGKHVPIISKDLFDDAQKQLHLQIKSKGQNKEFAFTKMLLCGQCGSEISYRDPNLRTAF